MQTKDLNLEVTGYCTHWNEWEAVREIATNARDVHPASWGISRNKNERTLTIWNSGGKMLMPHHFIMGVHQVQDKGVSVIGKFGEGLKVAITVLLRLGYDMQIKSGKYRYYPAKHYPYRNTEDNNFEGVVEEVAKQFEDGTFDAVDEIDEIEEYVRNISVAVIHWEEVPDVHEGTEVTIRNWRLDTDFRERFLQPNDTKIVFTDSHQRSILRESPNNLYVGDVYVCEMPGYFSKQWAFGYNLSPDGVDLNRDRNVANYWEINSDIARVWGQVDDDSLWELFFVAQETNALEGGISLLNYMKYRAAKDAMAKGFQKLHGDAVISTNHQMSAFAKLDGKKVVDVSDAIKDILESYISTDEEYVTEAHKTSNAPVLKDELSNIMKTNLRVLIRRSNKITKLVNQEPIIWHPFVFDDNDIRAKANEKSRVVYINIEALRDRRETFSVLIEELAHIVHGTSDNTRSHVTACCNIASELLLL